MNTKRLSMPQLQSNQLNELELSFCGGLIHLNPMPYSCFGHYHSIRIHPSYAMEIGNWFISLANSVGLTDDIQRDSAKAPADAADIRDADE